METIGVEPHIVLYAFRYGLGRATGAHLEALELVRSHWAQLQQWSATIVGDLLGVLRTPHPAMTRNERVEIERLLSWISAHPPEGWFSMGTHVDQPGPLQFSEELGADLLPMWERQL